ncbi:MAG TPA: glycosyltransferase [Allocoleopsis sp.]
MRSPFIRSKSININMLDKFFGARDDMTDTPSNLQDSIQNDERLGLDSSDRKLLVFELGYTGHYSSYLRHLAEYWCKHQLPGHLDIVVSPSFVKHHGEVLEIAASCQQNNLNFVAITPAEEASLIPRKSSMNRALRSFQEWKLLRKYATQLGATHCLLLYFDSFQSAIASGAKLPCPFSGIYFRPTFHYRTFAGYVPSWRNRLQHWREKFVILPRIMNHPQLRSLFCLDPFVVKPMERFRSKASAIHLPDPVQIYGVPKQHDLKTFKESLGIEPGRTVFLLFGALYDGRKGVHQVLDAISALSPDLCQKLCLLLVGQLGDNSPIPAQLAELSQNLPLQAIIRDGFVPEQDVQLYFQSADVILAPYQRHIGMSGILVQAAAAGRPLLSTNYGLMGEITRCWQLGLAVDATDPSEIAKGLTRFLLESSDELSDRTKMAAFAELNSAEHFASLIFQYT